MAVEYRVAETLSLTVIRAGGIVTLQELSETNGVILKDPAWASHFDTLTVLDPDAALHELDPSSLRCLADSTGQYQRELNVTKVRRAIVGSTAMGRVLSKYFVEVQSNDTARLVEYRVFEDVGSAVVWLGRSMHDVARLLN